MTMLLQAPIQLQLDPTLFVEACEEGLRRHLQALGKQLPNRHGVGRRFKTGLLDPWGIDIEGACAECVAAIWLAQPWTAYGEDKPLADVGSWIQVRWTSYGDYKLRVTAEDDDTHAFVLVTGGEGRYCLRGWAMGFYAKKDEWRQPATARDDIWYLVPQDELQPMADLRRLCG